MQVRYDGPHNDAESVSYCLISNVIERSLEGARRFLKSVSNLFRGPMLESKRQRLSCRAPVSRFSGLSNSRLRLLAEEKSMPHAYSFLIEKITVSYNACKEDVLGAKHHESGQASGSEPGFRSTDCYCEYHKRDNLTRIGILVARGRLC